MYQQQDWNFKFFQGRRGRVLKKALNGFQTSENLVLDSFILNLCSYSNKVFIPNCIQRPLCDISRTFNLNVLNFTQYTLCILEVLKY